MQKEANAIIFKPSILRFGLFWIAVYFAASLAGNIRHLLDQRFDLLTLFFPSVLITAGIGAIFSVLLAIFYNRIKITDDEIEGPQAALSGPVTVAIRDIDLDSLKKQMLKKDISSEIVIKTHQDEKITIDKFSFSQKTIEEIVGAIEERYLLQQSTRAGE